MVGGRQRAINIILNVDQLAAYKLSAEDIRQALLRQLADRRCTENVNWGLRDGSVWVNGGCRGVFRVDAGGYGYGDSGKDNRDSVTCASKNGAYTVCAWDRNRGIPRLLQTLSERPCTQGHSWGYSKRAGLWVNHGCRARFGVR